MADEADRFLVLALLQVAFLGKDPFHIAMPLPEVYGGNISRGGVCVLKSPSYHIQRGNFEVEGLGGGELGVRSHSEHSTKGYIC